MSDNSHDLWGYIQESVLMAYDEVREYSKNWKCNANTWWWKIGVEDEIQMKKDAYREMTKKKH